MNDKFCFNAVEMLEYYTRKFYKNVELLRQLEDCLVVTRFLPSRLV
jgi:hypothetical protein